MLKGEISPTVVTGSMDTQTQTPTFFVCFSCCHALRLGPERLDNKNWDDTHRKIVLELSGNHFRWHCDVVQAGRKLFTLRCKM